MRSRLLFGIVTILASVMLATSCARSDAGITTSVKSQLLADDQVKARRIDVDTHNRVVTLTGEVRSAEEEKRALQIARSANGVTDVVNQLKVVPEAAPTSGIGAASGAAADAGITAAVKSRLHADPKTAGLRIEVDTQNGVVTLNGKVNSETERSEAVKVARETTDVSSVTDNLTVRRRK
jgi:hyperosmotically inducible periplasmic protein